MAVVLDLLNQGQPSPPPGEGAPAGPAAERKPDWIRVKAPGSPKWAETNRIVRENKLVTVCEEAGCPNIGECWEKKHATFMIMGDTCTRACAFCNVKTGLPRRPRPGRAGERRRSRSRSSASQHVVVTSVDRDDLADGGAGAFRGGDPGDPGALARRPPIEVLTPDFLRKDGALEVVVAAQPGRLQPQSRDGAVEIPDGPPRRALLPLDPPAAAGEGARPGDLHQVRHHGRARRGAERGAPADGRPALGGGRFPDHRPVPAADAQAPSGGPLRAARRVQGLRDHRLRQGLPPRLGDAADPLVPPCRRGFRQAEERARLAKLGR